MGNKDPSMNVIICGVNGINQHLTEMLFPEKIDSTTRKIVKKDIYFHAKLFKGEAYNNLNQIKKYLNQNIRNNQYICKDIILIYPDEARGLEYNKNNWIRIANGINQLSEVKLPFIIFLTNSSYEETRQQIFNNHDDDIFGNFKDKRKIIILKIEPEEREGNNIEENRNIRDTNYKKILSLLWEINQILNQQPFKPSEVFDANLFRMEENESPTIVKILMSGFSRKGKSTFINLIFDKIVSLESPSVKPITSETIEFIYNDPEENINDNDDINFRGGIKIYDVPGLYEGINKNMNNVKTEIENSLKSQEKRLDVINYIVFILGIQPNFQGQEELFELLSSSSIKVIFIINDSQSERTKTAKETMIDYFKDNNFNNLIINNGENILELDIKLETKKIFEYIYNDLKSNNSITTEREIEELEKMTEDELFSYLQQKSKFFSRIGTRENFFKNAENKAESQKKKTIFFASLAAFSPIPFVDVPIILYYIAQMIIKIFIVYGFEVNRDIINDFFKVTYRERGIEAVRQEEEQENNNNYNNNGRYWNNLKQYIISLYNKLSGIIGFEIRRKNIIIQIIFILLRIFLVLLGIELITGYLDFLVFFGTLTQGIFCSIINGYFIKDIYNKLHSYCKNRIIEEGAKRNILNKVHGYRRSILIFKKLSQRNNWNRKIKIIN